MPVDYDALAKQAGSTGSSSAPPVDYDALAKQAGATGSTAGPPRQTPRDPINEIMSGASGSAMETALGAYDLLRRVPGLDKLLPDSSAVRQAIKDATPDTPLARAGRYAEQGAEFLTPMGEAAKLTAGTEAALRLAGREGEAALVRTAGQATANGIVSSVQSGGDPARTAEGTAIGTIPGALEQGAESTVPTARKVVSNVLGTTTGAGADAMTAAVETPTPELISTMRGHTQPAEVLKNFQDALQNVKNARSAAYQQQLAQIPKNITLDAAPVQQELLQQLSKFNIRLTAHGLDFSRSTISDPIAQKQIQAMVNDVANWGSQQGDLSPMGVDTLKRRIGNLYSDNSDARAITAALYDKTNGVLKSSVPGYSTMVKGYEDATKFIDSLRELSLESKNPATAIAKLSSTMRSSNQYRQVLTDALSQYTNVDLKSQLAGLALSSPAPRGLAAGVDLATGTGILTAVAMGHLNPAMAAGVAAGSPRLMGELLVAMSKAGPALRAAGPYVEKGAATAGNLALNPGR